MDFSFGVDGGGIRWSWSECCEYAPTNDEAYELVRFNWLAGLGLLPKWLVVFCNFLKCILEPSWAFVGSSSMGGVVLGSAGIIGYILLCLSFIDSY